MNRLPITVLATAVLLAACSKSEPPPAAATAPAAATTAAPAPAPAGEPAPAVPKDSRLLERLARQEAAFHALSPSMQEPAAKPAAAEKPAAAAKPAAANPALAAAPAAAPPPQAAKPAAASAPPPASTAKAAPSALPAAPSAPSAPAAPAKKPEPAPAPVLAKAAPAAEQPSRVLTRVDPDFPSEAVREGYDRGVVKARLSVDAEGNVTRVDIVESRPRRVFDRAVTNALSQWKFNAGKAGRAVETEIAFRR